MSNTIVANQKDSCNYNFTIPEFVFGLGLSARAQQLLFWLLKLDADAALYTIPFTEIYHLTGEENVFSVVHAAVELRNFELISYRTADFGDPVNIRLNPTFFSDLPKKEVPAKS